MTLDRRAPRGKFIYKKVSKIRWRPSLTQSGHVYGTLFLTGSWDDSNNAVQLWSFDVRSPDEPELVATYEHHHGDVNDIQFLNVDFVAVASSSGTVTLLKVNRDVSPDCSTSGWVLQEVNVWKDLHSIGSQRFSCNAVASSNGGESVASAGEDGQIFIVSSRHQRPVRTYERADSCPLSSVLFAQNDQVLAGNMRGQLKLFDLRSKGSEPVRVCVLSTDQVGVTCAAKHPSQGHVLCSGSEDGMLAFWDLRKEIHPVTLLSAHSGSVSEVQFHSYQPEHVFSCSQSGEILHWNGSAINNKPSSGLLGNQAGVVPSTTNPWLNSEGAKHRVDVGSVMVKQHLPLNSLDCLGNSMLFGGDNEAFYIIPDAKL